MALALSCAQAPVLAVVDGIPTTTSADVARHFGKRHDDVLRAIRNLLPQLDTDHARNFVEMAIDVEISGARNFADTCRKSPAYRLTRDGFTLLAMGFTGKKALAFKLAYIDAFNRMEAELHQPAHRLHGDTLQTALRMAAAAGAQVQQAVFAQLVQGTAPEDLAHGRWLVRMDHTGTPQAREIAADAVVGSYATIARNISDPAAMAKTESLAALAAACLAELSRRQGHAAPDAVRNLPADVRPLFAQAMARLCADAHADISTWAAAKLAYGCNLNHPDRREQRARAMLNELRFEDWLSHGEALQARALLKLFEVGGQMAAESMARIHGRMQPGSTI